MYIRMYIHAYIHTYTYIHTYQCTYARTYICTYIHTVDGERFAGLNIHGFSAIKVFVEIFSCYLGHKQCISTHYLV